MGVEPVGRVAAGDADHGVVDGRLDEPHVQDRLGPQLGRVTHQVVTASAFHSEMTVGSPVGAVAAEGAAVAVPAARVTSSRAAAQATSFLRAWADCAGTTAGDGWRNAHISTPRRSADHHNRRR